MGFSSKEKVREPYCRTEGPTESCYYYFFKNFNHNWKKKTEIKRKQDLVRPSVRQYGSRPFPLLEQPIQTIILKYLIFT